MGVDVGIDNNDIKKDTELKEENTKNESNTEFDTNTNDSSDNKEDIKTNINDIPKKPKDENSASEQRPIVQKIKIDDSNFEYNRNLANKSDNDFDINLSDGFDDRMGSSRLDDSTSSSENDSII